MAKILTIDEYNSTLPEGLAPIGEQLTRLLDEALPEADGLIWHGHPVWMSGRSPVAAFKAHGSHVTFMLWAGQSITDRSGRLEASGSATMTNLKLRTTDDIDEPLFINWLNQITKLNSA